MIVITSSEAGEGRTTTAQNLSALLVEAEARVRLVSIGEAIPAPIVGLDDSAKRESASERIQVAGAHDEASLKVALAARDHCDWIVLDAPPHRESLGGAALEAADLAIVLAREGPECAVSVARTMNAIVECKAGRNPGLAVLGVLVTMAARALRTFESTLRQLHLSFPFPILPYCIPLEAGLGDGVSRSGDGTILAAPWTRRARAYVELTQEVLHHG